MTNYSWQDNSPVRCLETINNSGHVDVVIHASQNADEGELHSLPSKLSEKGLFTVADTTSTGEPILRVYGSKDSQDVLNVLQSNDLIKGQAVIDKAQDVKIAKKDNVRTSGWLYVLGDVLNIMGGVTKGSNHVAAAGLSNLAASSVLIYGRTINPENPLGHFVASAKKELRNEGIDVSKYDSADKLAVTPGFKPTINRFLNDYSVETMIGINTFASYSYLKGGKAKEGSTEKTDKGLVTLGSVGLITSANLMFTRLLMENKHRMDPNGGLRKATDAMEKAALPIRGVGNMVGNVSVIYNSLNNAVKLWRDNPNSKNKDFWSALCLSAANMTHLGANIYYSKGKQKKELPFSLDDASAAMAGVLQTLPALERSKAVKATAGFFASKDPDKKPSEHYVQLIHDKIEGLNNSPFVDNSRANSILSKGAAHSLAL